MTCGGQIGQLYANSAKYVCQIVRVTILSHLSDFSDRILGILNFSDQSETTINLEKKGDHLSNSMTIDEFFSSRNSDGIGGHVDDCTMSI